MNPIRELTDKLATRKDVFKKDPLVKAIKPIALQDPNKFLDLSNKAGIRKEK